MPKSIAENQSTLLALLASEIEIMQKEITRLGDLAGSNDDAHQLALSACDSASDIIKQLSGNKPSSIEESLPLGLDSLIGDVLNDEGLSIYVVRIGIFSKDDPSKPYESHIVAAASDQAEDTAENIISQAINFCEGYFGTINTYSALGYVSEILNREIIESIKLVVENKDGAEIANILNTLSDAYPEVFTDVCSEKWTDSSWFVDSRIMHANEIATLLVKNMSILSIRNHEQFIEAMRHFGFDENEMQMR